MIGSENANEERSVSDACNSVLDFMDNWERFDIGGAIAGITDDASFTPDLISKPVVGKEAIRELWSFYMDKMQSYRMKVVNIAGTDNVVFLERVEYVRTPTNEDVELPIIGVFELDGEGKIRAWRDYGESTTMP